MPRFTSCFIILSMSCSLFFVVFFFYLFIYFLFLCFCLMFELNFLIHLAPLMHHTLLISSFLSLLPLDCFVYSWQKGGEYTGLYHHFYMTHVHTLRGRNSSSCAFVGGESHGGDAYTKGEKTFFYKETLFYLMLVFSLLYGALSYV